MNKEEDIAKGPRWIRTAVHDKMTSLRAWFKDSWSQDTPNYNALFGQIKDLPPETVIEVLYEPESSWGWKDLPVQWRVIHEQPVH